MNSSSELTNGFYSIYSFKDALQKIFPNSLVTEDIEMINLIVNRDDYEDEEEVEEASAGKHTFKISKAILDKLIENLNTKKSQEQTLYDNFSLEALVQSTSGRLTGRNLYKFNCVSNGISCSISEPTEEYLVFIIFLVMS